MLIGGDRKSGISEKFNARFFDVASHLQVVRGIMELQEVQHQLIEILHEISIRFQRLPGSAILLRYIKSSYQNDPIRSAVELFLFLFAVRYLLAPAYSTKNKRKSALTEDVRQSLNEASSFC